MSMLAIVLADWGYRMSQVRVVCVPVRTHALLASQRSGWHVGISMLDQVAGCRGERGKTEEAHAAGECGGCFHGAGSWGCLW